MMMNIAAQQPYFLPDFFFFYKMFLSDVFVIADFLLFRKQSPIARTYLSEAFTPRYLTIPVAHSAHHPPLPIYQQKIFQDKSWKKQHLQTLKSLYSQYPYFEYYYPELQDIYHRDYPYLHQFLQEVIFWQSKIIFPAKALVIASKENLLDINALKKWLETYGECQLLIYPQEVGYYQQHFSNFRLIDTSRIERIPFPSGYRPYQSLLILLFLEGPAIGRFFKNN